MNMMFTRQIGRLNHISRCIKTRTAMRQVHLAVEPRVALVDDKVSIVLKGACPNQPVTFTSSVTEPGAKYIAHAHYKTDANGSVDLTKDASLGGTYTGVEPMGLFWSMVPAPGQRSGLRLMKKDIAQPFRVSVNVMGGHVESEEGNQLKQVDVERWYLAPGVTRVPVREGRLRGMLFLPEGPGPFPGVIDMFGTAGGIIEIRAALLAARGFATLALPYFAYDDLPDSFDFQLEYFEEAVDWLCGHPSVKNSGIGVIGVSMGSDFALYLPTVCKKVIASVAINGFHYYTMANFYKGGVRQVSVMPEIDKAEWKDGIIKFQKCYHNQEGEEEAEIPVHRAAQCQFLLVYGESDGICGHYHYSRLRERFEQHGCTNYRLLSYPGTGHLLEPPYTPLSAITFHKVFGCNIDYGGEPLGHARAQEHSWQQILAFFHRQLNSQTAKL